MKTIFFAEPISNEKIIKGTILHTTQKPNTLPVLASEHEHTEIENQSYLLVDKQPLEYLGSVPKKNSGLSRIFKSMNTLVEITSTDEVIETNINWIQKGIQCNKGTIIEIGKEIAVVQDASGKKTPYKVSSLQPIQTLDTEAILKAHAFSLEIKKAIATGQNFPGLNQQAIEGTTRQFGANDTRRLGRGKDGKLRWMDADEYAKEVAARQPAQNNSEVKKFKVGETIHFKGDEVKVIDHSDKIVAYKKADGSTGTFEANTYKEDSENKNAEGKPKAMTLSNFSGKKKPSAEAKEFGANKEEKPISSEAPPNTWYKEHQRIIDTETATPEYEEYVKDAESKGYHKIGNFEYSKEVKYKTTDGNITINNTADLTKFYNTETKQTEFSIDGVQSKVMYDGKEYDLVDADGKDLSEMTIRNRDGIEQTISKFDLDKYQGNIKIDEDGKAIIMQQGSELGEFIPEANITQEDLLKEGTLKIIGDEIWKRTKIGDGLSFNDTLLGRVDKGIAFYKHGNEVGTISDGYTTNIASRNNVRRPERKGIKDIEIQKRVKAETARLKEEGKKRQDVETVKARIEIENSPASDKKGKAIDASSYEDILNSFIPNDDIIIEQFTNSYGTDEWKANIKSLAEQMKVADVQRAKEIDAFNAMSKNGILKDIPKERSSVEYLDTAKEMLDDKYRDFKRKQLNEKITARKQGDTKTKFERGEVAEIPVNAKAVSSKPMRIRDSEENTYQVTYAVVPMSDVIQSHEATGEEHADHPKELQARNRKTEGSKKQMSTIASEIDERVTEDSADANRGAPVGYSKDGKVYIAQGNGRTAGIKGSSGDARNTYYGLMVRKAAELGMSTKDIQPTDMLVRVLTPKHTYQDAITLGADQDTPAMPYTEVERTRSFQNKNPQGLLEAGQSINMKSIGNKPINETNVASWISDNPEIYKKVLAQTGKQRAHIETSPKMQAEAINIAMMAQLKPDFIDDVSARDTRTHDLVKTVTPSLVENQKLIAEGKLPENADLQNIFHTTIKAYDSIDSNTKALMNIKNGQSDFLNDDENTADANSLLHKMKQEHLFSTTGKEESTFRDPLKVIGLIAYQQAMKPRDNEVSRQQAYTQYALKTKRFAEAIKSLDTDQSDIFGSQLNPEEQKKENNKKLIQIAERVFLENKPYQSGTEELSADEQEASKEQFGKFDVYGKMKKIADKYGFKLVGEEEINYPKTKNQEPNNKKERELTEKEKETNDVLGSMLFEWAADKSGQKKSFYGVKAFIKSFLPAYSSNYHYYQEIKEIQSFIQKGKQLGLFPATPATPKIPGVPKAPKAPSATKPATGLSWNKSQGQEKPGHKYLRREKGKSGKWEYIYEEPTGRQYATDEKGTELPKHRNWEAGTELIHNGEKVTVHEVADNIVALKKKNGDIFTTDVKNVDTFHDTQKNIRNKVKPMSGLSVSKPTPKWDELISKLSADLQQGNKSGHFEFADNKAELERKLKYANEEREKVNPKTEEIEGLNIRDDGNIEIENSLTPALKKKIGDRPVVMYHLTNSESIKNILKEGLKKSDVDVNRFGKESQGVYLSSQSSNVAMEGYSKRISHLGGEPILIEVKTKLKDILPDPDDSDIESGKTQFIAKEIKPEDILNRSEIEKQLKSLSTNEAKNIHTVSNKKGKLSEEEIGRLEYLDYYKSTLNKTEKAEYENLKSRKDFRQKQSKEKPTEKPQSMTETPEFKEWFKDSKVVDKDGKPLKVFHGSFDFGFKEFKQKEGGTGIYFSSKKQVALGYAHKGGGAWLTRNPDPKAYEVYLNAKNPLTIDANGTRNDNIPVPWQQWKPKNYGNLPKDAVNIEKAAKYARENGYDSLIVKNTIDTMDIQDRTKSDVYVVFDPKQIKIDEEATSENPEKKIKKSFLQSLFIRKAQGNLFEDDPKVGDVKTENGQPYKLEEETAGKPRWHKIKKIISVVDTREYELDENDRAIPIAGSGDIQQCDRCGRDHVIHATVELENGERRTVGTSCMKQDEAEIESKVKSITSTVKRIKTYQVKIATAKKELERNQELWKKVEAMELPEVTFTEPTKDGGLKTAHMDDATVWIHQNYETKKYDFDAERKKQLVNAWQMMRLKELGGDYYRMQSYPYEIKESQKKIDDLQKKVDKIISSQESTGEKIAKSFTNLFRKSQMGMFGVKATKGLPVKSKKEFKPDVNIGNAQEGTVKNFNAKDKRVLKRGAFGKLRWFNADATEAHQEGLFDKTKTIDHVKHNAHAEEVKEHGKANPAPEKQEETKSEFPMPEPKDIVATPSKTAEPEKTIEQKLEEFNWESMFEGGDIVKFLQKETPKDKRLDILDKEIEAQRAKQQEWKDKKYKQNEKVLSIGGKDEYEDPTRRTIGSINEGKRNRAIKNFDETIKELQEVKDEIEKGSEKGNDYWKEISKHYKHFNTEAPKEQPKDVTETEAFKKWFQGSKVVDENQKPLAVWHGTKNDFTEFDLDKAGSNNDTGMWGTGFYFSPNKKMSLAYGDKLKKVYLSIQNPLIINGNVSKLPEEFRPAKETHGEAGKKESDALRERLLTAGYDGVIQYEPSDKGLKLSQVIAFNPEQIKSVKENEGTFDPTNPDITKSINQVSEFIKNLFQARQETNTNPTPAQKEAGNYKKGTVTIHGLEIAIENPKGSFRSGKDRNGKEWKVKMTADYGYFKAKDADGVQIKGKDKDEIDVFIGNDHDSEKVFIVNQINPENKSFDEHKVIIATDSEKEALKLYKQSYSDNATKRIGSIAEMTMIEFKEWLYKGNKSEEVKPKTEAKEMEKPEHPEINLIKKLQSQVEQLMSKMNNPEKQKKGTTTKTVTFTRDEKGRITGATIQEQTK